MVQLVALEGPLGRGAPGQLWGGEREEVAERTADEGTPVLELVVPVFERLDGPLQDGKKGALRVSDQCL